MDNKKRIKDELIKLSSSDEQLKKGLEDTTKNIDGCFKYITNKARTKVVNGCACISDDVVFGWAIHYYIESNEDLCNETKKESEELKEQKAKEMKEKQAEKNIENVGEWF